MGRPGRAGKDAPTGEALIDLVENQLFPTLKELDLDSMTGKTRERGALLRGVFEDAFNYMKNGTLLRQVINKLNADIDFNQSDDRHLFGDIYEQILKDLQGAGNAGEFYTPRAATQFAVQHGQPATRRDDPRPRLRHRRLPHPRLRARAAAGEDARRAQLLKEASTAWRRSRCRTCCA